MIASAVLLENSCELTLSSVRSLQVDQQQYSDEGNDGLITLEEMEKRHILRVLRETKGNRKKTAEVLGINTATVYRKIEKYRMTDNRFSDQAMPKAEG